jgi:hypothetical protein
MNFCSRGVCDVTDPVQACPFVDLADPPLDLADTFLDLADPFLDLAVRF